MEIEITYIGRRFTFDGTKLHHVYIDEQGNELRFGSKLVKAHYIGARFKCQRDEKTFSGPYSFVGTHKDSDDTSIWYSNDRTAFDLYSSQRKAANEMPNEYMEALTSFRFLYSKTPHSQRQVLLNRLIADICKR